MMWLVRLIPVARASTEALFNGLWQGILLCILVACVLWLSRRANAATRYAIWWATLVAIACLPLVRTAPPRKAPLKRYTVIAGEPERPSPMPVAEPRVGVIAAAPQGLPAAPEPRTLSVPRPVATVHVRDRWPLVLFGAWLAGVALMLARLAWSCLHVRGLRRDSAPLDEAYQDKLRRWLAIAGGPKRIKLHATGRVSTPMSLGPVDPMILMPADVVSQLTETEFDQVLLHELAHVRREDNWSNLVQRLIEALLFFNPAVWWAARRMTLERESACDDWVVAVTGEAKSYAACLAKLVEVTAPGPQPALATGIFRGARQISTRIERLLDRNRNTAPWVSPWMLVPAIAALFAAVAVCAEVRAVLAGPVIQSPLARLQAVAQAVGGQAASQAEKQAAPAQAGTPKPEEQPPEVEDQVQSFESPEAEEQVQRLMQDVESLQSLQAAEKAREAAEQIRQLKQGGFEEWRTLQDEKFKALTHELESSKKMLESRSLQKLAESRYLQALNQEMNLTQSNGWWNGLNVRTKGQIEFTDDDSDVKSVSPGGSLIIEERSGWTTRKYEVTPTDRRYSVNGHSQPIDEEGKAWLAEVLPQVIRESAVGADARVKRIMKQHGPAGVLGEISKISSDNAKRIYFQDTFAGGPLPPDILKSAARQMGREIASDGEKARLLVDVADAYLKDESARTEYFDAVATIASDGEHRRVLSNALQKDGRNKETLALAIKSAARIASDGEKARVLVEAADSPAFDDSVSAEFLRAVNGMTSDGEHARVLMALMRPSGLSRDAIVLVMKSAGRIASDGERSRVLVRASEFYTSDAAVRQAFFNAAATMASDGEHSRVLLAVLARTGLDKDTFIEVIRSAERMASDGEKARVLRQVAAICPNDDAIVTAMMRAIETISSDGEYRGVMSAVLGRSDLSAKVPRIKYI